MELNISNYRIVNAAEPTELQDVTTKNYVDHFNTQVMVYIEHIRNLTPLSDEEEYCRYINLRKITCHSLANLVIVKTDIPEEPHPVFMHGGPYIWIESPTSTLRFKVTKSMNDKHIQVTYRFPVKVNSWTLWTLDEAVIWRIKYTWEWSDDGANWTSGTAVYSKSDHGIEWCGNNGEILLNNEEIHEVHKHWRIVFKESRTVSAYIYINYLQMDVSPEP